MNLGRKIYFMEIVTVLTGQIEIKKLNEKTKNNSDRAVLCNDVDICVYYYYYMHWSYGYNMYFFDTNLI